ncbi:hypothetical protein [Paenibacillus contaminans]|uniref:Uncharacterized protein n=1 Tax=Paenibacillus contaminans TaxID=450362 RepID=A0A329MGW0_9BACL|nr:hypothetical protein [Paenibacillus contaminans]RAV19191.1 hypothetical protein DQG23_21885 [Paenibacillus contaminans]
MPGVTRGAEEYCELRWSPILPDWNRVQLPFLIRNSKMPAYSGCLAKYTGKSSLQAGKFGLQHMGKLDSFVQVGKVGLHQRRSPVQAK